MAALIQTTPYITHHQFCGKPLYGSDEKITIERGTALLDLNHTLILTQPIAMVICLTTSENGKRFFSRNNDQQGLLRGDLTHAIAYKPRECGNGGFRFTEAESEMLLNEYNHWLRQDVPVIIFNNDFFNAEIADLRKLANKLHINININE